MELSLLGGRKDMEKETFDFIVELFVDVTAILGMGIGIYLIHLIHSSRKEKRGYRGISLDGKMEYTPFDKPYEKLWEDSGLSTLLDMDGASSSRLNINRIWEGTAFSNKYNSEEVYRDAILELMKDGARYKKLNRNDLELRKYCIEHAGDGNAIGVRIKNAATIYDYISTGIKTKKVED